MSEWATERFLNLPAEKVERVLAAALDEFSTHGFRNANTNRIAETAGVSVGALFKYFTSKENLFRYVVEAGVAEIETLVGEVLAAPGDVLTKLEAILRLIVETSRQQRQSVVLYQEITAAGNRDLVREMSLRVERYTSAAYTELLRQGQADGQVRPDVDAAVLAFCIDNLFMTLQFSLACDYYQNRLGMYAPGISDDTLVAQVLAFVAQAIQPGPAQ